MAFAALCLLYASTNTRPDIAFATGLLCRAMGRATPELFEAALRVLATCFKEAPEVAARRRKRLR